MSNSVTSRKCLDELKFHRKHKPKYVKRLNFYHNSSKLTSGNCNESNSRNTQNNTISKDITCDDKRYYVEKWLESNEDVQRDSFISLQSSPVFRTVPGKRLQKSPEITSRKKRAKSNSSGSSKCESQRVEQNNSIGITSCNLDIENKVCTPTNRSNVQLSPIINSRKKRSSSIKKCKRQHYKIESSKNDSEIDGKSDEMNFWNISLNTVIKRYPESDNDAVANNVIENDDSILDLTQHINPKTSPILEINQSQSSIEQIDEPSICVIEEEETQDFSLISFTPISLCTDDFIQIDDNERNIKSKESNLHTIKKEPTDLQLCDYQNISQVSSVSNREEIHRYASNKNSISSERIKIEDLISIENVISQSSDVIQSITKSTETENKISLDSSSTTGVNMTISSETSSAETNNNMSMFIAAVNPKRKKRLPKICAITARLHSLINKEVSHIRLWCHRLKKSNMNDDCEQSVTVQINKSSMLYGKQFLEGIVLIDPFKLLNPSDDNKCLESLQNISINKITIMLVPDIVGKIVITHESIIKIYPPWDIVNERNTILNVKYLKVISTNERLINAKIEKVEKRLVVVQEYDCPCMKEKFESQKCSKAMLKAKPDIMQKVFTI